MRARRRTIGIVGATFAVLATGACASESAVSTRMADTLPEAPPLSTAATVATDPAAAAPATTGTVDARTPTQALQVGGLVVSIRLVEPVMTGSSRTGIFATAVELPDGTVLAAGIDGGLDGSGTDRSALWRSSDAGATFERLELGFPAALGRDVAGLAHHDGVVHLFGSDETEDPLVGASKVWSSSDLGTTWDEHLVTGGSVSWGGIVGGVPTIAVSEPASDTGVVVAHVYQLRDGTWSRSATPESGTGALVLDVVELPNGTALAIGERCDTDPGFDGRAESCGADRPQAPVDSLAWVSRDGGLSWVNESAWLGGVPHAQYASAATMIGDQALIGITSTTLQGDIFTLVLNSTTDGPGWSGFGTMPPWDGGAVPAWFADLAPLGSGVLGLVLTDAETSTPPYALIHDTATGAQEMVELMDGATVRIFDLVTIAGKTYGVGVRARENDIVPALIEFDVGA